MDVIMLLFGEVKPVANIDEVLAANCDDHPHPGFNTSDISNDPQQGRYSLRITETTRQHSFFPHYSSWQPETHNGVANRKLYRLGGELTLEGEQQTPANLPDASTGLRTGRAPGFCERSAHDHWTEFQGGDTQTISPTVAVVNWTAQTVTMYIRDGNSNLYFRDYHVAKCDLGAFVRRNRRRLAFSGVMKGSLLAGSDKLLVAVKGKGEGEGECGDSWRFLGVAGNARGVRVEMAMAGVLGLAECRCEDPSLVSVDMDHELVRVHGDVKVTMKQPNCFFLVFDFNAGGWAQGHVLVE